MDCREIVSVINPGSIIPELINSIRHSFRESEYDEVQNILMEREMKTKLQIEELVRDRDSLKKENDLLEGTQGYSELEKFNLQEKLKMSERRCQELDKEIVQMRGNLRILKRDKLDVEEKLATSNRKSEEMDERLLKMEMEIEELRREKLDANRTIEELKEKEIEADQSLQELQRKCVEASQTIVELTARKMESDKVAEAFGSRGVHLETRITMLETKLANLLSVNVEDFPNMVNGNASTFTDSKEGGNEDDSSAGSGVVGLAPKGQADGASAVCTYPSSVPAFAESCDIVQDNVGEEPNFKGKAQASSSAARIVIVLSDSDDEPDSVDTTHIPDTLPGLASKRNRTECGDDSLINLTAKRERRTSTQPSRIVDSDNESYSDAHVQSIKTKGRND